MTRYYFDLDETICATPSSRIYADAIPYLNVIKRINGLYYQGHTITIFTSRGSSSGIDYRELTEKQLLDWGVKFDELLLGKPSYDVYVDDKAINSKLWRQENGIEIVGFVASCFDLLHAGHCQLLKEAKSICDRLICGLHTDPSLERQSKNKPVQSLEERYEQLSAVKYVDEICVYDTEEDLVILLESIKPDIRIVGEQCDITGKEHCSTIYYHDRTKNGGLSSSELRKRVFDAESKNR